METYITKGIILFSRSQQILLDQLKYFPRDTHDDGPDALEMALREAEKDGIGFVDLEKKKETGELGKYTKKEQLNFDREIAKLKVKFDGVRNMSKLPDAVFIFGLDKDLTCAKEAIIKGIK